MKFWQVVMFVMSRCPDSFAVIIFCYLPFEIGPSLCHCIISDHLNMQIFLSPFLYIHAQTLILIRESQDEIPIKVQLLGMTFHLWIQLRRLMSDPAACPLPPSATGEQNIIPHCSGEISYCHFILLPSVYLNHSITQTMKSRKY